IFIPVTVGCKERLWFLDTGAGISVIDSTFASELGLAFEGELAGQGVGNTVSFSFVKLPPMSLKGIEFDEQTIGSLNIQSLLQKAGLEAVGILGFDFISRFVIKVDYANKTLSFYDPETFEYDGSGIIIDAPLVGNNMTVKATVDGKYTGNWQLDLGAGGNSFHYPFAKANGFNKLDGIDRISLGAGGEMRSRGVLFNDFEIGGLKVNDLVFGIPQATKAGGFGGGDLIGNIGNSFLRHFTLYLDYNKQKLIVEKGGQFDHVFPLGKSGLQIMFDDNNNYEVICVSSNTPAENSGFKKGDILVSINGIDINNFSGLESIINIMKKPVGTKYSILIYRDGAEKKLTMKLKDIY
ncbi:MAG: PDZ domain-containing protein, partial [candidate division Zixibacteria bacterium]|nr:PDZ domain-containing protein [candidate division Zixibacteria bacterium]